MDDASTTWLDARERLGRRIYLESLCEMAFRCLGTNLAIAGALTKAHSLGYTIGYTNGYNNCNAMWI